MSAALGQMSKMQLKVEATGRKANVPNNPTARLMYYLGCVNSVLGDCIPRRLADESNYYKLDRDERNRVIELAREFPPSKIPLFIQVNNAGSSNNEFLEYTSIQETVTALGIHGDGDVMTALRRQIETQQVLTVMIYVPAWVRNNYYGPLEKIRRKSLMCSLL